MRTIRTRSISPLEGQLSLIDLIEKPLEITTRPVSNELKVMPGVGKWRKRTKLFEDQKGLCAYCDITLASPANGSFDHVKPKAKGGGNEIENLRLVCPRCNSLKAHFYSMDEVEKYLRKIETYSTELRQFFERLKQRGIIQ